MTPNQNSLFTSCLNVLGNDHEHATYARLIEQLNEKPTLGFENQHIADYDFTNHGIQLIYQKSRSRFRWAVFFINSPNVKEGKMQPYTGPLLKGITTKDSLHQIVKLFPGDQWTNRHTNESSLEFEHTGCKINFYFNAEGDMMTLVLVKRMLTANTTPLLY